VYNSSVLVKEDINMEENENMIKLVNEEGEEYTLEILDVVNKDGIDYVVALPEDSEDEVVILEVTPIEGDDENVEYTEVIDDELGDEIFNEFIKRQDETEE
jgi:uncharacterized protein YrzB (UPF0473 family)